MRLKLYRGKWAIVGKDAQGRQWRRSLGTADRAAAERRFRDLKVEVPGDTNAEIIKAYLADKKDSARSYKSMETAWRALEPTFGALRPDQITRELCRDYAKRRRRGGVKDGTIIKDLGVLKAALGWAKKAGSAVFDMPATPPPRERYLTKAEVDRLIENCALPHVQLFVRLAWGTAGRASALFDLTWDRVDFTRGHIRLAKPQGRGKGRATVSMTNSLRASLLEAYNARTTDYVIEWGGKAVKSVKRSFAEAARKAGLDDVSPHVIRHSAAVAMAEDGAPMHEIAAVLGHTDPRVTFRVYARFSPDYLKRAMRALE